MYGARHAIPGVSRANLIAWQRSFRLPQTSRPSFDRVTLKKNKIITRILCNTRVVKIVCSILIRTWGYPETPNQAKKSEIWHLENRVFLKIHHFINAHLLFPFLYRRNEVRSNPSPKCWVVCTHIRVCIVLFLVATTKRKKIIIIIRSWILFSFLRFIFRTEKENASGNKRNDILLIEVVLYLRKTYNT